jgi:hypothetical protein
MFEAIGAVTAAILKIGVPIYIAGLIASSLLIFLPGPAIKMLGLAPFRQAYQGYLGSVFVVSLSLIVSYGLSAALRLFNERLDSRRWQRQVLRTLQGLTSQEKSFIRPFIADGKNTCHASISDGVTGGLRAKGILYRSSNIFEQFSAPYNLQTVARELLTANPHLLE